MNRLPHLARSIHALGPRPLAELLVELHHLYGNAVLDCAERYARLDPGVVRALGADRFPPRLAAIDGGRR